MNTASREIFGNILHSQHVLFDVIASISIAIFAFRLLAHFRRWMRGNGNLGIQSDQFAQRLRFFAVQVFQQPRIRKRRLPGAMHFFIFWGFMLVFVGMDIVAVQEYGPVSFFDGLFYLILKIVMNAFGALMLVGVGIAVYRCYIIRPERIAGGTYGLALTFLGVLGLTGFLLQSFRMATRDFHGWCDWSQAAHFLHRYLGPPAQVRRRSSK